MKLLRDKDVIWGVIGVLVLIVFFMFLMSFGQVHPQWPYRECVHCGKEFIPQHQFCNNCVK